MYLTTDETAVENDVITKPDYDENAFAKENVMDTISTNSIFQEKKYKILYILKFTCQGEEGVLEEIQHIEGIPLSKCKYEDELFFVFQEQKRRKKKEVNKDRATRKRDSGALGLSGKKTIRRESILKDP